MFSTVQLFKVMLVITIGFQTIGAISVPHADDSIANLAKRASGSAGIVWDGAPKCPDIKAKHGSTVMPAVYCAVAHRDKKAIENAIKVTEGTINSATKAKVTLGGPTSDPGYRELPATDIEITDEFKGSDKWDLNSDKIWPALLDRAFQRLGTKPDDPDNIVRQDIDVPLASFDGDLALLTGNEAIFDGKFVPGSDVEWTDDTLWNRLQKSNDRPTVIQAYTFAETKFLVLNRSYAVKETRIDGSDKIVKLWDPADSKDIDFKYDDIKNEILAIAYYKDSV